MSCFFSCPLPVTHLAGMGAPWKLCGASLWVCASIPSLPPPPARLLPLRDGHAPHYLRRILARLRAVKAALLLSLYLVVAAEIFPPTWLVYQLSEGSQGQLDKCSHQSPQRLVIAAQNHVEASPRTSLPCTGAHVPPPRPT